MTGLLDAAITFNYNVHSAVKILQKLPKMQKKNPNGQITKRIKAIKINSEEWVEFWNTHISAENINSQNKFRRYREQER